MSEVIRIRGTVQGVGFRPVVAKIARARGLAGYVRNDAEGVLIGLAADNGDCEKFLIDLMQSLPPLARVDSVDRTVACVVASGFQIDPSAGGLPRTEIAADAAMCAGCREEMSEKTARRFGYAFTTCTNCGPRYSIARGIPFDRVNTSMASFRLCPACRTEYEDETDRRYHAQTLACFTCGPRVRLAALGCSGDDASLADFADAGPRESCGSTPTVAFRGTQPRQNLLRGTNHGLRESAGDDADVFVAAANRLLAGEIIAVKGLGGYQLCCDATNSMAVQRLRARKRRPHKPLAVMVADAQTARRCVELGDDDLELLRSPAAPIVLLARTCESLPVDEVAPGQSLLGIMLPTTPLHARLLGEVGRPLVCTSGNLTNEPQCIDDDLARDRLAGIADGFLLHNRPIVNRVDDSLVAPIDGAYRVLRRARGYAPGTLALPEGFEHVPPTLALGGDLKGCFALLQDGRAILSPHLGDLDHAEAFVAYRKTLDLFFRLFEHRPEQIAYDAHAGYRTHQLAVELAHLRGLRTSTVLHHHAHIAACLAENMVPLTAGPVLGLALDGLGAGADGELWGGELLVCDYRTVERIASLEPVALIGGDAAARQPWRNLYAHLRAAMTWEELTRDYGHTEPVGYLQGKPIVLLEQVLRDRINAPVASSTGRLFDAVSAALGLVRERLEYEGQAAMMLEALVDPRNLTRTDLRPYPFAETQRADDSVVRLSSAPLWRALLNDLALGCSPADIATKFHKGLARALVGLVERASHQTGLQTVALSGGCWQNRILFEAVANGLRRAGLQILAHRNIPPNDGGLALGQAVIACAREL